MSRWIGGELHLGHLGTRLLDAALPAACPGCGVEGSAICPGCLPAFYRRDGTPAGISIGLPSDIPSPLLQLEWCAPFTGVARRALHQLKYAGERRLTEPLGRAAARRWRAAGVGADLLAHVPVHEERGRQRGYDQAQLLAEVVGRTQHMPTADLLRRARVTRAQYELGRGDRAANVAGAFEIASRQADGAVHVEGRWILLVDDVVTTGATLAECARVLLAAGALGVSAVTVARER